MKFTASMDKHHHIVLISLDALRADRLGCYGDQRGYTPTLDGLAAESLLFRNATSPATWTLPGHMSMLSGLEPPVHGCVCSRHQYPPEKLPFPLIFELLGQRGYALQAVVGGGFMEPQFGFGKGLDNYIIIHPIKEAALEVVFHMASNPQTFSFLHTYMVHDYPRIDTQEYTMRLVQERDPHYEGFFPLETNLTSLIKALALSAEPPLLPRRDVSFVDDLYYANVIAADFALKMFIKRLRDRGLWDQTTLILTADHGESLGDVHNGFQHWFHAGPPFQEQICVPLMIKPAAHLRELLEPPGEFMEPVSLVDIVPTLLDLEGVPTRRDQFDGLSLVDLCSGQVAAFQTRRLFFHTCADEENIELAPRLHGSAMTWRDHGKMIASPLDRQVREFYSLGTDPQEAHNRVAELGEMEIKQLHDAFGQYWKDVAARAHMPEFVEFEDQALSRRLADLGYID